MATRIVSTGSIASNNGKNTDAVGNRGRKLCLFAAFAAAAAAMPATSKAQTPVFQVTAGDFNPSSGVLTPDVGPTGTLSPSNGGVTIVPNATVNGASALLFNGTAGFDLSSAVTSPTNQWTIFAVVLPSAPTTNALTIVAGGPDNIQYRIDGTGVNNGEPALLDRDRFQYGNASVAADTTKFSLIDVTNDPTSSRPNAVIFSNNGAVVGDSGGDAQNVGNITNFGSANDGGNPDNEFFNGQIAEVQVYNTALTAAQRQTIENQLLTSFGIISSTFNWVGGTGPYSTGSNWDQGTVPNNLTSGQASIGNGGTAQIVSSDSVGLFNFFVGGSATGTSGNVVQTGGSLTVGNIIAVGNNGSAGTYNMSGGTLTASTLYVGGGDGTGAGTGVFTQTAGDITFSNDMEIGHNNGIGVYNMSGGTITDNAGTLLGIRGFGATPSVMNLSGTATITFNQGALVVGETPTSGTGTGILNMSGNTNLIFNGGTQLWVGNDGGNGVANISGGSLSVNSWLVVGRNGGTGLLNLSGPTSITIGTSSTAILDIAASGNGVLNQAGGSITSNGPFVFLAEFGGWTGSWNMSGGTANIAGTIIDGYRGTGIINISGTAQLTATGVNLGQIPGAVGSLNLDGGMLTTQSVFPAGGSIGTFNMNGGVLQAAAGATALIGSFPVGTVNALAGGAIIDTNGNNVSVNSAIGSPSGVIGSVTKMGAGTLTFSKSNTYTGRTTISAGTLQLIAPAGVPVPVGDASFETVRTGGYTYFNGAPNTPVSGGWSYYSDGGITEGAGITSGVGFNITGAVPDGNQVAFIQRLGAIQQALSLPSSATYTLSFQSEQRGGNANSSSQVLEIDLGDPNNGGTVLGTITPGNTWAPTTYVFSASGNPLLTIQGKDPDGLDNTALVDAFTLTVPGTVPTDIIPDTSPVVISDNATFDVNGNIETIGSLTGTSLSGVSLGSGTLSVGGDGTSTTFAGAISGTGSLIKIGSGSQTLSGSNTYAGGTTVSGGVLKFASPRALPKFTSLTIGSGALAVAATHGSSAAKNTLFVSSLTIAGSTNTWTGTLDLGNNDMVVRGGNLATISNQLKQGYNSGNWQGSGGIVSSAAAASTTGLTTLGSLLNNDGGGSPLYTTFDGQAVTAADVLVKYTYYGDANLDGVVNGSDYTRIDNGYNNHLTGWSNGDFNYDGVINGSDYTLIDNAFNTQGGALDASSSDLLSASPTDQTAAVPEPASVSLLVLAALSLGRRTRRTAR